VEVRVVGVVPKPSLRCARPGRRSYRPGRGERTIADGLHGNIEPGSVTFELVRERVEGRRHRDDAAIEEAMGFLASEHGLVTEGAGAAAVAALRSGATSTRGRTVAIGPDATSPRHSLRGKCYDGGGAAPAG
jgi:threonine dehydratase